MVTVIPLMTNVSTDNRYDMACLHDVIAAVYDDSITSLSEHNSNKTECDRVDSIESKRRTRWRCKVNILRDELEAIGLGLRRVGVSLRGSVENLVNSHSSSPPTTNVTWIGPDDQRRRITVELVNSRSSKRTARSHRSTSCGPRRGMLHTSRGSSEELIGASCYHGYHGHDFTSFLTVNELADGVFTARMALDMIPHGDVIIRVHDYRLEIIVEDAREGGFGSAETSVGKSTWYCCGSINIPIYVDTNTMQFCSDDTDVNAVFIKARMKVGAKA